MNNNQYRELPLQLTQGKIKWMTNSIENFYYICDTGQDEIMTISVENFYYICDAGQDKINDSQHGEFLLQLWHWAK